jgi:hypothetical protein
MSNGIFLSPASYWESMDEEGYSDEKTVRQRKSKIAGKNQTSTNRENGRGMVPEARLELAQTKLSTSPSS